MKTNVNRKAIKENRIFLDIENKKHSNILKKIPEGEWPIGFCDNNRTEVWRSNRFLVQVFNESDGTIAAASISPTPAKALERASKLPIIPC